MLSAHERAAGSNAWQNFVSATKSFNKESLSLTNQVPSSSSLFRSTPISLAIVHGVFAKPPRCPLTENAGTRAWMWLSGQEISTLGQSAAAASPDALEQHAEPFGGILATGKRQPQLQDSSINRAVEQPPPVVLQTQPEPRRSLQQQRAQRKEEEMERRSERSPSTAAQSDHTETESGPSTGSKNSFLGLAAKVASRASFPHPVDHSELERKRVEESQFARLAAALAAVKEAAPERFGGGEFADFMEELRDVEDRAMASEHAYHQMKSEENMYRAAELGVSIEVLTYGKILSELSSIEQEFRETDNSDEEVDGFDHTASALQYGLRVLAQQSSLVDSGGKFSE